MRGNVIDSSKYRRTICFVTQKHKRLAWCKRSRLGRNMIQSIRGEWLDYDAKSAHGLLL
jgi:hypothetical protein